jgi:hypothetical protein
MQRGLLQQQLAGAASSHPAYKTLDSEMISHMRRQRDALLKKLRKECEVEIRAAKSSRSSQDSTSTGT